MLKVRAVSALVVLSLVAGFVAAQQTAPAPAPDFKTSYTKTVYQIAMRDGAKLYTVVYAPRDTSVKYPILLNRTPYTVAPYGEGEYKNMLGPSAIFEKAGYIFAYQDVRGRFMSEGEYVDIRPEDAASRGGTAIDESTDTYDTIDYLVKNVPNNNGRVGLYGVSYPGFYAACGAINAHPALKAVSPQAPVSEWFYGDDFHHNGAFFMYDAFAFYPAFGAPRPNLTTEWPKGIDYGTPDAYQFYLNVGPISNFDTRYLHGNIKFWTELMAHPNYDEFWKARSLGPRMTDIKPATMTVGGWFDAEDMYGALHLYQFIEKQSPRSPRNMLVMGPWSHGGWARSKGDHLGQVQFGSETSRWYNEYVELPFFDYYLKDKGTDSLPEAVMFNTGANEWKKFQQWPPSGLTAKEMFARKGGRLAAERPGSEEGFEEYVSDPAKPVPFTAEITDDRSNEYMVEDQRFASRRPDVVTFQSDALAEDLTVAGPITASLFVSMTGTDADFIVKVIDVYPDDTPGPQRESYADRWLPPYGGFQQLLRWEVMRGKFRNGGERPEPFKPGVVTPVKVALNDVLHTFKKGHRIMVQVQSSYFPLIDRNPQKFCDIYKATDADFQKSTIRIYRSAKYPTSVSFEVMGK